MLLLVQSFLYHKIQSSNQLHLYKYVEGKKDFLRYFLCFFMFCRAISRVFFCFECDRLIQGEIVVAMISVSGGMMCGHVTLLVLKVRSRDLDNLRAKSFYVRLFVYVHWREVQVVSRDRSLVLLNFWIFFFKIRFLQFLNFFREVFFLKVQLHGFACLFCKSEAKIDCLRISANFFLQNFCFANYFKFFFRHYKMARATFSSKSQ